MIHAGVRVEATVKPGLPRDPDSEQPSCDKATTKDPNLPEVGMAWAWGVYGLGFRA